MTKFFWFAKKPHTVPFPPPLFGFLLNRMQDPAFGGGGLRHSGGGLLGEKKELAAK